MGQGRIAAGLHHVDSGGSGVPLLLLHGAGGTLGHWPQELRALPGRRVIAVDLGGHGGSPPPGQRSIGAYARSVLGLCDALAIGTAAVAGHSMGGAVALTLALESPSRVAALALVGTGARLRVAQAILEATADPARHAAFADTSADFAFGEGAAPELRRAFVEGWRAGTPAVTHGDFSACDAFDVIGRLGEIRAPTLVVCGAADRLTPLKYSEALRDRIPGARLTTVARAGHMVQLEAPGAVAAAIAGFLGEVEGARS